MCEVEFGFLLKKVNISLFPFIHLLKSAPNFFNDSIISYCASIRRTEHLVLIKWQDRAVCLRCVSKRVPPDFTISNGPVQSPPQGGVTEMSVTSVSASRPAPL